jgi:hypothetical protein
MKDVALCLWNIEKQFGYFQLNMDREAQACWHVSRCCGHVGKEWLLRYQTSGILWYVRTVPLIPLSSLWLYHFVSAVFYCHLIQSSIIFPAATLKCLSRTRVKVTQGHDLNSAIELTCELLKCSVQIHVSSNVWSNLCCALLVCCYRGADKSLAQSTTRCILFDGENISFDSRLVIYIYIYIYTHIYIYIYIYIYIILIFRGAVWRSG